METIAINGLTIYFEAQERETAEQVRLASERSLQLMDEHWGIKAPRKCRIYVMTSWEDFMFQSAGSARRVLLRLTYPLWAKRVQTMWEIAGGWNLPARDGPVVGIKPTRLIREGDPSIGGRMFIPEEDPDCKVQQVTCHELMHAFSSYLKLPMWLHEGLAILTVDLYVGRPTVRQDTLELLRSEYRQSEAIDYRDIKIKDKEFVAFQVVRGYWLTRYLDETQPELLRDLMKKLQTREELEAQVTAALGFKPGELWLRVNELLIEYFGQE